MQGSESPDLPSLGERLSLEQKASRKRDFSPPSQSRPWTVTPTAGDPVAHAVSRGGGRDFAVLRAALPPGAQEFLQLQETVEGIREGNLQPGPGPLQRTRLHGAEPAGSGQAKGLEGSCGWAGRGQSG